MDVKVDGKGKDKKRVHTFIVTQSKRLHLEYFELQVQVTHLGSFIR